MYNLNWFKEEKLLICVGSLADDIHCLSHAGEYYAKFDVIF